MSRWSRLTPSIQKLRKAMKSYIVGKDSRCEIAQGLQVESRLLPRCPFFQHSYHTQYQQEFTTGCGYASFGSVPCVILGYAEQRS